MVAFERVRDRRGQEGAGEEIDEEEWERGKNAADDPLTGVFTKNCIQSNNGRDFVRWVSRVTLFSGTAFQGEKQGY